MYNVNNQVNFATKTYGYSPTKSSAAKTETEKDAASKSSYSDGFAISKNTDTSAQTVKLSSAAENYLKDLKEKYGDYDFIIADYSSDEEASKLLSKGDGSLNVLITPDILEKMATDENAREYYEGIISGAQDKIKEMTDALGENADKIDKLGFTLDADGKVDYYALMKESFKGEEKKVVKDSFIEVLAQKVNDIAAKRDKAQESAKKKENSIPIPPESFEKYRKKEEAYPTEEDYGNIPPESFEKYRKEDKAYPKDDDYGNLPPESFKKYRKTDMNYSV